MKHKGKNNSRKIIIITFFGIMCGIGGIVGGVYLAKKFGQKEIVKQVVEVDQSLSLKQELAEKDQKLAKLSNVASGLYAIAKSEQDKRDVKNQERKLKILNHSSQYGLNLNETGWNSYFEDVNYLIITAIRECGFHGKNPVCDKMETALILNSVVNFVMKGSNGKTVKEVVMSKTGGVPFLSFSTNPSLMYISDDNLYDMYMDFVIKIYSKFVDPNLEYLEIQEIGVSMDRGPLYYCNKSVTTANCNRFHETRVSQGLFKPLKKLIIGNSITKGMFGDPDKTYGKHNFYCDKRDKKFASKFETFGGCQ